MAEPLGRRRGTPLASVREADVFAIDARRVLRRYRNGGDVGTEAEVMTYVGALGFPVPVVYSAEGTDLVLERLDGPTMVQAFVSGDLDPPAGGRILAELHALLHALPPRPGADAGARILHLDLHPENVMLTARGPVLIDWRNATEGPPDLDIAVSAVILAEVGVDPSHELTLPARSLLASFLDYASGDPVRLLDRAVAMRRANGGAWSILKNTTGGTVTTLASGSRAALGTNSWHHLALALQGTTLTAKVDGTTVGSASDGSYAAGPAGRAPRAGWVSRPARCAPSTTR